MIQCINIDPYDIYLSQCTENLCLYILSYDKYTYLIPVDPYGRGQLAVGPLFAKTGVRWHKMHNVRVLYTVTYYLCSLA